MKRLSDQPDLKVKAYTFSEVWFEGDAYSLSAQNKLGPIDILPGHANILTMLSDCDVVIQTNSGEKKFRIDHGLLRVASNQVTLFVNA